MPSEVLLLYMYFLQDLEGRKVQGRDRSSDRGQSEMLYSRWQEAENTDQLKTAWLDRIQP